MLISGACTGGEGAPDLTETLLNLSINSAALAGFSFLFFRDLRGAEKDRLVVDREEQLGRLLVCSYPMHYPLLCVAMLAISAALRALHAQCRRPPAHHLAWLPLPIFKLAMRIDVGGS